MKDGAKPSNWKIGMDELWCFPRQGAWTLATSSEIGRLDGWRIVPRADTGTGLSTVAGACKELTGAWSGPRNACAVA
jgi:hypothetical protein